MTLVANKDLLYREFGLLLATARKRRHLSQAQLATLAGLSRTSVTNIECGRQPIQLHQLYSFAAILAIDTSSLLPKEMSLAVGSVSSAIKTGQIRYLEQAKKLLPRTGKSGKSLTEGSNG